VRVKLQLEIPGRTHERCSLSSESLKRFDARRIGGHEFRQIEFDRTRFGAGFEQFRDLFDTQPASQSNQPSIGLLNDTNPAIHAGVKRKTQATRGPGANAAGTRTSATESQ
jgi:hypothetical protein